MLLLGGGFQAGPWFQNTVALGAFGVLATRYDWIPAWFPPPAPPCLPSLSEDDSSDDSSSIMAQALDRLIEESEDEDLVAPQVVRPQRACLRRPIIEASSSEGSSSDEEEEDAASPIRRAARRHVRVARRPHEQGIERTVRAAQRMEHTKELAEEMASWVSDADRQLERFAASLDREVIVDYPVDNTTTI